MKARLEFKLQDCWIGAYWDRENYFVHLWICLIPMLPLHLWWPYREEPPYPGGRGAE